MRNRFWVAAVLALWLSVGTARANMGPATLKVKDILEQAMEIQTRPDLQGPAHRVERAQSIRKLIADHFLAEEMAKAALDRDWSNLRPEQQAEFRELFTVLFQDSYTRMVLNFLKRETIEYGPERMENASLWVQTIIMRVNEHIPVDYQLVEKKDGWYVQDVKIDGISIVKNYRNAFHRVITRESLAALLEKMRLQRKAIVAETE